VSDLSPEMIASLLATESAPRGRSSKKEDITLNRDIRVWMKLSHHFCTPDCEHRTASNNSSDGKRACWNPNCVDPRPTDDRGICAVAQVAGVYMCRFCFLDGWLLPGG